MGKFVIKGSKNGGFKFDLKAGNGQVLASSQIYKGLKTCQAGVASVIANAPAAAEENQTVEGFAVQKHPKFEIYEDNGGKFRFRLKAKNGQIVAVSKPYKTAEAALTGVASVKKQAEGAETVVEAE